ncbi:hypothetical protein [Actinomadura litoris]|uniref:hypothetical protein n=1 Tax=Actinomadura litoris TaxID=2678616 RepID=UPI001FA7E912|nr:hypothetical protein [Actinomadura litoris]
MKVKTTYLEYWAGTDEYVFTDENGETQVFTGEDKIRDHLTSTYRPQSVPGWLLLAHAIGPEPLPVVL